MDLTLHSSDKAVSPPEVFKVRFYTKCAISLKMSRTRLLKSFVDGFLRTIAQNTRCEARECLWGPHDGRQHFGVQISPKPSTMAFYKHLLASANELETHDVI